MRRYHGGSTTDGFRLEQRSLWCPNGLAAEPGKCHLEI